LATPIEQLLDIAHGLTFQSINYWSPEKCQMKQWATLWRPYVFQQKWSIYSLFDPPEPRGPTGGDLLTTNLQICKADATRRSPEGVKEASREKIANHCH
jgi:hypothetical protein